MSLDYLKRSLIDRQQDAKQKFLMEAARITQEAAAAGALHGSRTFILYMQAAKDVLEKEVQSTIQFTFNLFGHPSEEILDLVTAAAGQMMTDIVDEVRKKADVNDKAFGGGYMQVVNRQQPELERKLAGLLDGFKHGMMGDEKLKKEPSVSVVNNQTNSPGAVQQVGTANINMSAFNQHHQSLVQEIEKTLTSPEFLALSLEKQEDWRDLAEVVKAEAEKSAPDEGKLKRWGKKLVEFSGQVGLTVAAETIAGLLAKMYIG